VVPARERDLDLRVELRDGAGATTTARDLRVAAIATPADAVHHAYGAGPFDFDAASPASVLVATPAAATAPHLGLGALVAHQRDSSGNLSVDWLLGAPLLAELPQRTPRTAPQTYFAVRAIPASETAPLTLTANVTTQTIGRARAVSLIAAPYAAFGAIALRTASVDQQLAAGAEADVTTWTVPADVGGPALVLLGISASQPCPSTPSRRAIRFTIGGSEAATFAHDIDSCIYRVPYGTVAVVPDAAGLTLTTRVDAALSPLDVGDDFALVLTPR
jgi:hypothetical protein